MTRIRKTYTMVCSEDGMDSRQIAVVGGGDRTYDDVR